MLTIKFYDVEHGCCTHIITPNGKHILVDVGSKTDKSIVNHIRNTYFRQQSNPRIDELIITHPHEDHIYDLPELTKVLSPKVLRRTRAAFDITPKQNTQIHINIANAANNMNRTYNQPVPDHENVFNPENNGGVQFEYIPPVSHLQTKDDPNTFSCILVVKYQGYKFILTGDNPSTQLQYMIDNNYSIRDKIADATVLLAPHHGRKNEFCRDFFNIANPILTVISDKSIEHATQEESASLYKGRGAELYGEQRYVLTTRKDGNITFNINNMECSVQMNKIEY